jgi:hypothetical protein
VGARLLQERERSCDEDVIELGNEPEVYAESLLETCRFYVGAGGFDFDLTWIPDQIHLGPPEAGAPPLPPIDVNGPSIFAALPEQLGLKLEATRAPVEVLVIDRVEHPTSD